MARIEGVHLPNDKRVEYGLTYIRGIGLTASQNILDKLKIINLSHYLSNKLFV